MDLLGSRPTYLRVTSSPKFRGRSSDDLKLAMRRGLDPSVEFSVVVSRLSADGARSSSRKEHEPARRQRLAGRQSRESSAPRASAVIPFPKPNGSTVWLGAGVVSVKGTPGSRLSRRV